jgi:type VI secretion system protein ImpL
LQEDRMKKIVEFLLHPVLLSVLGIAVLAALVWWVGPLIAFGQHRPLDGVGARLGVIGALVVLFGIVVVVKAWRRRRANAALIEGIGAGPSASDQEAAVLDQKFSQAIAVLRESQRGRRSIFGGGQYVYELPWYAFVGAPGSGKTTALMNAGLTFPLAAKLGQASVKGVGGTRNCDWWFTDQAVLIDTAGRYALQESDAATDSAAWGNFLALLKKTRPRRPLNGILLTVNIQDLLQQGPAERKEHASRLRARMQELHAQLGVRPPVYVLITKADLIAGFNETFGELSKEDRDQVWGVSFAFDPSGAKDPLAEFGAEFSALERRIRERLIDRLEAVRDVTQRAAIFAFPQQLAGLKGLLGGFLEQVFSSGGALEERPLLRGVYLTSGTQEGTPIDRVMGTLARTFGVERKVSALAGGRGKSFFLHRLLADVVFAEQGLVGANRAHELRQIRMRLIGVAAMLLITAGVIGGWAVSYLRNKSYVAEVAEHVPALKQAVDGLPPSTSSDLATLPVVLGQVREAAQSSKFDVEAPPLLNGLGLYQGDKLDAAAELSYRRLLDHALMPRVARRLEERLRSANKDNLELAYEALKAYLMLYTPEHFDADALKLFVTTDWEVNLQRTTTAEQRAALGLHLDAMLARGAPQPSAPMDKALVASVREMLIAYPLEYRIVSRLKRQQLGANLPEFSVASAAGPAAAQVFERASGKPLTQGVPGLYTREGYRREFLSAMGKVTTQLANEESWVLGTPSATGGILKDSQASSELTAKVRRRFLEEYIKVWDDYLADVRMIKATGLEQSVQLARLLSAPDSPLAAFLRGASRETTLVEAAPAKTGGSDTATGIGAIDSKAKSARKAMAAVLGAQSAIGGGGNAGAELERMVDDHFAALHRLFDGQPAPIDDVLKMFNEVYVQLSAINTAQKSKSAPPPSDALERIKASAGQQPEPIRAMLGGLADSGSTQSRAIERQSLTGELKPTTDFCSRAITGRYPFAAGATADVLPEDFAQLFGVGGMLDDFYQRKLAALVDTGTNPWSFKPTGDGSKPVAAAALADFQRAARIKEVFFRGGGKTPSFRVDIRAVELSDPLKELTLDIDGQPIKFVAGNTASQSITWPSAKVASQIKLSTVPASTPVTFDGPWALFRLFDRFEVQPTQQPEKFVVVINLDGKHARLEVTANSVFNPFRLREIQQFRCPGAL